MENIHDLISLQEASEYSGFSTGHLRHLLRNQELDGLKIGRNWLTTKTALDKYLSVEHKPGRKPQE